MGTAIVVGLPRAYIRRIDAVLTSHQAQYHAGWRVEHVPARRIDPEIFEGEMDFAMNRAESTQDPHIIGVSKQDGAVRQQLARRVKRYFRFRWFDNRFLQYVGSDATSFVGYVNTILEEEDLWSQLVRPRDIRAALLLPEECFATSRSNSQIWNVAEQYGDIAQLRAVPRALDRFKEIHWRVSGAGGRDWIDDAERIYGHTGPRHAIAPFPRNWKYSFRIPDGFHYDVAEATGKSFAFRSADGRLHGVKANGYINVDPHGHCMN